MVFSITQSGNCWNEKIVICIFQISLIAFWLLIDLFNADKYELPFVRENKYSVLQYLGLQSFRFNGIVHHTKCPEIHFFAKMQIFRIILHNLQQKLVRVCQEQKIQIFHFTRDDDLVIKSLPLVCDVLKGLASHCKAEATFTFHSSILTLLNAF